MIFVEKFGVKHYLLFLRKGKHVFYGKKSLPLEKLEKLLPGIGQRSEQFLTLLNYGHIQHPTGVMQNAYLRAKEYLDLFEGSPFLKDSASLFEIDFPVIFRKHIFSDIFYPKLEKYELVKRYVAEHPEENHTFYLEKSRLLNSEGAWGKYGKIYSSSPFSSFLCLLSIALLPLYLWFVWKKKGKREKLILNNTVICYGDSRRHYQAYCDLLQDSFPLTFMTCREYLNDLPPEKVADGTITVLDWISWEDYQFLKKHLYHYQSLSLRHIRELSHFGMGIFSLLRLIVSGRIAAPGGKGNTFVTFEHFNTLRGVRNEFIRQEGSQSVFFSMNLYPMSQYHCQETFHNYDILCSSGKHLEELYKRKFGLTKKFLPVGSYDVHKGIVSMRDYPERLNALKKIKGEQLLITFLLPGVCEELYSNEVRLMDLALKVSQLKGIKVIIRMKPFEPIAKYRDFYQNFLQEWNAITLTGKEYELFDFIGVTDLFVTSLSSSGCEVAMLGGQVMYVDFFKTPDRYYFWEVFPEVKVEEEEAFDMIKDWILDGEGGKTRIYRKEIMKQLVEYLGYKHPTFDAFRNSVIEALRGNMLYETSSGESLKKNIFN